MVSNHINLFALGNTPLDPFIFHHLIAYHESQKYAVLILPAEFFQAEMTSAICHTVLMLESKANHRENKYLSYRLAKYLC